MSYVDLVTAHNYKINEYTHVIVENKHWLIISIMKSMGIKLKAVKSSAMKLMKLKLE